MKLINALVVMGSLAQAHYTMPRIKAGGVSTSDWQAVRQTANYQSNGPVTNVQSSEMTCYELSPGKAAPQTVAVTAGSTLTYEINPNIYHPGPLNVYMAKAPSSAASFDGKGNVWFKVYNEAAQNTGSALTWPSNGKASVDITIPKCIADGEYLVRIEHIALHSASSANGAQLYISCAQVKVSGGSGTASPSLMAFPGAYSSSDPGLLVNIYYPIPTNYKSPGGNALQC
jgi:hypothetical protein